MKKLNNIGLIGFGNMGKNLAINILNNNYKLSIYNRSIEKLKNFNHKKYNFNYFKSIKCFINSIEKPRKIFLIIKNGKPIDLILNSIINYLEENDIIMDLSNSLYKDSIRRHNWMKKFKIHYLDIGVSGGIKGALDGLSLMVGCESIKLFNNIKSILEKISYKKNKKSHVNFLGNIGIGHYIKMIHNSIEYSKMQILSEIYFILKKIFLLSNNEIGKLIINFNNTNINSYLLKITSEIILKKDINNDYILNKISDEAENNNTGKWAIKNSLDIEEFSNISSISLLIRYISCKKKERDLIFKKLNNIFDKNSKKEYILTKNYIINIKKSIYVSSLFSYIQGISQIEKMSKIMNWKINISKIIESMNNGTIIESVLLDKIIKFIKNKKYKNYIDILFYFKNKINLYSKSLRKIILLSIKNNIPTPALNSSLLYYDILNSKKLSTNLIQAQRNYFGNHLCKLIDEKSYFNFK